MFIFVDDQKINVDKYESIYTLNLKLGEGTIRYKGIVLKKENNFAYYNISENDKLTLNGIKGGSSTKMKIISWIVVILILFGFIIFLCTGLITFLGEFMLTIIKNIVFKLISNIPGCDGSSVNLDEIMGKRFKYVKLGLNLIFLVLIGFTIYFGVYCYSNLASLGVYYMVDGANQTESVCKGSKAAGRVGFWTAMIYTIIYVVLRLPLTVLTYLKNDTPSFIQFILNIPLATLETFIVNLKANVIDWIPYVGEAVAAYLEAVAAGIEYVYDSAKFTKVKFGDPARNNKFDCNDIISLYNLFDSALGLSGKKASMEDQATGDLLSKFGVKKYFNLVLPYLAFRLNKMANDDNLPIPSGVTNLDEYKKLVNSTKSKIKNNDQITLLNNNYNELLKEKSFLFPTKATLSKWSQPIVCQIVQFLEKLSVILLQTDADSEDATDIFYSGSAAGVISLIVFLIVFIYYLVKAIF